MRIAHLSAEVSPFAKTGGLGDVAGALPIAQAELGHEASVWMPLYRTARNDLQRRGLTPELACDPFEVEVGFERFQIGLLKVTLPGSKVPCFFVGQDRFFNRPEIYSPDINGMDDGLLRYAVFVRAAMEGMRKLQLVPDVLHAHDWHTTLAPMAVGCDDPRDWHFEKTATVLTVHNLAYQGMYSPDLFYRLNLPRSVQWALMWKGALNLMKGGLLTAHAVTAVSPRFAWEIGTGEGGFGLEQIVRERQRDLYGILNGIDTRVWNPELDTKLPAHYSRNDLSGKASCRKELLKRAGMDPNDPGMVVGIVSRLTSQKGLDMLFPVLAELIRDGIRFVMLGSGDGQLERAMYEWSHWAPGRFWGYVGFDDALAHQIEAGADAFLMPSRFEPCGLNQMYSLAYGTPPIVRRVGGLADTVHGYDGGNGEHANGFGFDDAYPEALRETVRWANLCFKDSKLWHRLMLNAMNRDFSWKRSAEQYLSLYQELLRRRRGK